MNSKTLNTIKAAVAAVPCFVVVFMLLRTWIDPMSVNEGKWVSYGVGIMVLEFIMVHSGFMMACYMGEGKNRQWKTIALMTMLYALFAGIFALMFESWGLVIIFTAVMASRWSSFILDPEGAMREAISRSIISMLFYMFAVIATLFIPLPELGMTQEVVDAVYPNRGSGEWEDRPQVAIAAGILYFSLLGLAEYIMRIKAGSEAEA